jgi:hypothetical protein
MKYFLMLAAAASLAACHNRSEDEVGAAPDRGDTTAVTATDTTAVTTDSTMGQTPAPSDSSYTAQDSTTVTTDTTMAPNPSGNQPSDTASQQSADTSAAGAWDSTSVSPTDSTKQQ